MFLPLSLERSFLPVPGSCLVWIWRMSESSDLWRWARRLRSALKITTFFLVVAKKWVNKVDLPVPARPVMKTLLPEIFHQFQRLPEFRIKFDCCCFGLSFIHDDLKQNFTTFALKINKRQTPIIKQLSSSRKGCISLTKIKSQFVARKWERNRTKKLIISFPQAIVQPLC